MSLRLDTVSIDADDPEALARWWAELLGWEVQVEEPDEVAVVPPDGVHASELLFVKVPDAKTVKNRVHLDLRPDDQAAEVARAEAMGARRVEIGQSADDKVTWVVLADPEGNEFCILRAKS
jgi:predicted enzyme related to lactoylglutathione lyase